MPRTAVFPGSFDPITLGHEDIIRRAARMFDTVYVAVGNNTSKKYLLDFQKRQEIVTEIFSGEDNIAVVGYDELTVELCRRLGARYLVRGLRNGTDFDYEKGIAQVNQKLFNEIETIFLISHPDHSGLSSTIVREIHRFGGDLSSLVPAAVLKYLGKG